MLVPCYGTLASYLCNIKQRRHIMKNTDFTLESINSMISSDDSLSALAGIISDLGLELIDIEAL